MMTFAIAAVGCVALLLLFNILAVGQGGGRSGRAGLGATFVGFAAVAGLLLFVNMICAQIKWSWWWTLWNHEAFWAIQFALLLSVSVFAATANRLAKRFAGILAAFAVAGAVTVIVREGTQNAELPAYSLVRPTSIRKEDMPTFYTLKANEWSEWIVIMGYKVLIYPGDSEIVFEVKDASGNVTIRRVDKGTVADWKDNSVYQRFKADRDVSYTIEKY